MSNLVDILILLLCVFLVDSRDTRRSSVKHKIMHKRTISDGDIYDGFKKYRYCYEYFLRLYSENADTYHGLCHARDKLTICTDSVIAAYPSLKKDILGGYQNEYEVIADFWCMYNKTHHGPAEPFDNMENMYRKYIECPYVHDYMLTHEDYSIQITLAKHRAEFAHSVMTYTGSDGLSKWQDNNKYSDPNDPVYKALCAMSCDWYKYETYFTDTIMSRYCVIVKDINDDLYDTVDIFHRQTMGLYNMTRIICTEHEDPLERVMRFSQLDKWLSNQKKPDLSPCHDHNIYINGATCLIMFHTKLPPYTDIHNLMQPFAKNIAKLNSCWDQVISGCAHPTSASRNINLIIEIYNLVSDITKENSAQVWDVIWSWSEFYKKTERAQAKLQVFYGQLSYGPPLLPSDYTLAFGSSLEAALSDHKSPFSHNITDLFSNLSSAISKLSVVANDDYKGVNIFEGFRSMNDRVLYLLFDCLQPLFELFVEVGEFVQHKGRCPEWWDLQCE